MALPQNGELPRYTAAEIAAAQAASERILTRPIATGAMPATPAEIKAAVERLPGVPAPRETTVPAWGVVEDPRIPTHGR